MAVAMQTADTDMAGDVPMDMHSGYEAYEATQLDGTAGYQQAPDSGEHPAQRLRRLQAEAAQLAAQQSQVSLCNQLLASSGFWPPCSAVAIAVSVVCSQPVKVAAMCSRCMKGHTTHSLHAAYSGIDSSPVAWAGS
jgi:hypothetical protein